MIEEKIIRLIREKGPLIGSEIQEVINGDPLVLWRTCRLSKELDFDIVGSRYMRLDRNIEGFARLSPSVLREFLSYTVIGLAKDAGPIGARRDELTLHIEKISKEKSELAYNIVCTLEDRIGDELLIQENVCFIIAGDIVYNMAHDVPRPERSTGKMVQGSDMDIVVIVDDDVPERVVKRLDEEIYKEKYNLLLNPHHREEIDYIVKGLDRVRRQVKFDTFKHMVACKIMHEGAFLYGNEELFYTVKDILRQNGVVKELHDMEDGARLFRKNAEELLLKEGPGKMSEEDLFMFYPSEESEEFE